MIYGELGINPMSVYIELRMINFWSKMVNGNDSKIANILYKYMFLKNSQNQYKSDWLKCIKNISDRCGYSKTYLTNSNKNGDLILKTRQKGCLTGRTT
jgi:hypothetical protein